MNKVKLIISILSAIFCMNFAWADMPANLANQCAGILATPFPMNNPTQAASYAGTLNSCEIYNVCSIINNVPNCINTLKLDTFLSNYFFYNPNNNSNNGGLGAKQPATPPQMSAPAPASTPAPANNTNNTSDTSNSNSSTNDSNKQIHWF